MGMKKQRLSRCESSTGLLMVMGQLLNGHLRRFATSPLFTFYLVVVMGMAFIPVGSVTAQTFARDQEAMTNATIIELVKAGINDEVIIQLIRRSKTKFDISPQAIVQLKKAGVSDRVLAVMLELATPVDGPTRSPQPEKMPTSLVRPPAAYGLYIEQGGQLLPLGRVQTKIQISKWRRFLGGVLPFVRQKIDINIPSAHSANRFSVRRPTFYAYFPPSRDVSKFKLLQCKITGQRFDQRTVANASILFSIEQNQDEIPCDIGPTDIRDLYRIVPREDLSPGEYAFVEGNSGSKSASNIDILDVFDFGIDREGAELALDQYLDTLPPVVVTDTGFHSWTKEECQKIVAAREGKVGLMGNMLGWFKRQYASLDIYWVDDQFARAFARLEMLERNLSPEQANKLYGLLRSADQRRYVILVAIGQKVGSGRLIGANEGERLMRPYDATLSNPESKGAIIAARRVEPLGGYAGLWKVSFDRESVSGQILSEARQIVFEARLNQNLDVKATFEGQKLALLLAQDVLKEGR